MQFPVSTRRLCHCVDRFEVAKAMFSPFSSIVSAHRILKPAEKKSKYVYGGMNTGRPVTPPRKQKKGKEGK